jgi:hypothetical protein
VKYEGKRVFFGFHAMWPEMKENEGLDGLRRDATSCNFLDRRVNEHQRPAEIVLIARTTRE